MINVYNHNLISNFLNIRILSDIYILLCSIIGLSQEHWNFFPKKYLGTMIEPLGFAFGGKNDIYFWGRVKLDEFWETVES